MKIIDQIDLDDGIMVEVEHIPDCWLREKVLIDEKIYSIDMMTGVENSIIVKNVSDVDFRGKNLKFI